jgi:hypothetical protein
VGLILCRFFQVPPYAFRRWLNRAASDGSVLVWELRDCILRGNALALRAVKNLDCACKDMKFNRNQFAPRSSNFLGRPTASNCLFSVQAAVVTSELPHRT